ncbi:MAG: MBL fold metallo-hydrolase [Rhodospirillaceae bacterium]|nr:MBL fold metallo-hydrolase [Rhodospirillaceae bacterium]
MSDRPRFITEFDCEYGVMVDVSPTIRRIVAQNPGPFTFKGTATYVVGHGKVAVIDPGPDLPAHVDALLEALDGEEITHQLITHTHKDHSPAAQRLQQRIGASTYGFGPHGAGKYEKGVEVEEGGDPDFTPDHALIHGDRVVGDGWSLDCVYTPGHTSNHLCYAYREENALFTGDHVMGWSTTVVSPPDGDMREYLDSLRHLSERNDQIYYPTHGAPIENPGPFVRGLIAHRKMRERQIISVLEAGENTIRDMVPGMYKGLDPILIPAAQRSVFAHVIDLVEQGKVVSEGDLAIGSRLRLL